MLPERNTEFTREFIHKEEPSKVHEMHLEEKRIIGMCDGLEAVKQAVFKILNTERYKYSIYSRNYGIELEHVFGKPVSYAVSEIERVIKEALLQDDRITAVKDFSFTFPRKNTVSAQFTVVSTFGSYTEQKEVMI